ncbi:MAG: cytochrome c biogenesis protein CcsA [Planctomycetota bacterium]
MDTTALFHYLSIAFYLASAVLYLAALMRRSRNLSPYVTFVFFLGMAANGAAVIARTIDVQHAPFHTRYEAYLVTGICTALGFLIVYLAGGLFRNTRRNSIIGNSLGALTAIFMVFILYRTVTSDAYKSFLPPALQSVWFWPHVTVYLFGYGALFVAVCASVLYIIMHLRRGDDAQKRQEFLSDLDQFTYRTMSIGFPFLTMGLVFGALWAEQAWGTYWGWDSKEVWSLITWIVYLLYLHLRMQKAWRGQRSAWFLIIGAVAIFITFELIGILPSSQTSLHKYTD